MHVFRSRPSGLLKIGNEDGVLALQGRAREDAFGEFQRGAEPRAAGGEFRCANGGLQPTLVLRCAHILLGVAAEEHQRGLVGTAERIDHFARLVAGALPPIAVPHARGLIEQDHDLSRASRRCERSGCTRG